MNKSKQLRELPLIVKIIAEENMKKDDLSEELKSKIKAIAKKMRNKELDEEFLIEDYKFIYQEARKAILEEVRSAIGEDEKIPEEAKNMNATSFSESGFEEMAIRNEFRAELREKLKDLKEKV